jgi:hypothetical protein
MLGTSGSKYGPLLRFLDFYEGRVQIGVGISGIRLYGNRSATVNFR